MMATTAIAQPSVSYLAPAAVAPGRTTEITLHGTKLDGPLHVWTSFPANVEIAAASSQPSNKSSNKSSNKPPKGNLATAAKCRLALPAGASAGIGGLVVANRDGVSDVAYLLIDDLPSIASTGSNRTVATAQNVVLPAAIDASSGGTEADYYRFNAKSGTPIGVEIVAARLGWDFDAVVRVRDASGRELLIADDEAASGPDARFTFTPPADGPYILEVHDNRYKSGGRYRLRLGDLPLVTAPLPLLAQRGALTAIDWRGPGGPALPGLSVLLGGVSPSEASLALRVNSPPLRHSGWGVVGLTDLPVMAMPAASVPAEGIRAAANNPARPIDVPCAVSGVLTSPGERNVYEFAAKKGTPVRFTAISRSLGSPAIVVLRVFDLSGKQLAESPVTQSDEPALNFRPPADGRYRLVVEDLAGRGRDDFVYAIECRTAPQFSLQLKNDKNSRVRFSLASGGAIALDVECQRFGYDGPITLDLDSPASSWQLINRAIAAKATATRLYILPPLDFAAGSLAALRIVGRSDGSARPLTAAMTTTLQLRAARPQMPYPPAWHDGALFVAGVGSRPAFFHLASADTIELDRETHEGQLSIHLERLDAKFKDALTIIPVGLPAGVSATVTRSGNGPKETYDLLLKGKAPGAGEHTFRYLAYGELAGQGRGVLSGEVRLTSEAADKPTSEKQPAAVEKTVKSP